LEGVKGVMRVCKTRQILVAWAGTSLLSLALLGCSCGDGDGGGDAFTIVTSVSVDGGIGEADEPRGIALDEDGNLYATGYVTPVAGNKDIWLARYDSNLILQESLTLDGSAHEEDVGYAIALDGSGYLYVVGYMSETGEGRNIWLAKYDTDLLPQRQITVNGSASDIDEGYGIIFDGAGHLYVAGTLTETGQGYNIWIAKYDTDLNLLKSIILNGPANGTDKGRFLALDGAGSLFVSGSVTQPTSGYDIWLGKFDTDLNPVAEKVVAGPVAGAEDKGYGILFDGSGTLYVTGTLTEPGEGYNIWLAKYDTDLNLLDSITLNGPVDGEDTAYSISPDGGGNLYQTGVYTEAAGGSNIWVARYTTGLALQSYTTVNGAADGYDTGLGIIRGRGQDLYVSASINELTGGVNIWLARYKVWP
jgi:hypothetical protein